MRWSKFINFYDSEDGTILFNSVNRAASKLDNQTLNIINEFLVNNDANKLKDEIKTGISELYLDEFLVKNNYSEFETFRKVRHDRDQSKECVMYFIPTFNCNFRCPYCIVSSTDHDCENPDNIMSDEDTVKAAHWLINYVKDNKLDKLTVELFGGEPMLGHDKNMIFLRELSQLEKDNIELNFNMISNCYSINKENIKELKDIGLRSIQCTIDGPKIIHDKRRILSNGEGSFDKIIENIKTILDNNIDLVIRMNVDEENAPYISELIQYLAEEGFNKAILGIAPVDPPIENKEISGHTLKVMNFMTEMYKQMRKYNFRYKMWETFCGFGTKHFFVICPDGKLYNCPSYAGMEGYSVGSIHTGGFIVQRPRMHEIPDKCYNCSLVGICAGGCRFTREVHNMKDSYCLKSTHSVMVNNYITSRFSKL